MDYGIATVGAIVVIAMLVGKAVKLSPIDDKWIPVICGASGCILGIVAFLIKMPDMPAQDIITAAAIGVASGFAATGIHQVYAQLTKNNDEVKKDDTNKKE